ncbi:MAG: hypothetical protein ACREVI_10125 [Steroidobacteraceae bacterium]
MAACSGIEHPLRHLKRTGNIGLLERAALDRLLALGDGPKDQQTPSGRATDAGERRVEQRTRNLERHALADVVIECFFEG